MARIPVPGQSKHHPRDIVVGAGLLFLLVDSWLAYFVTGNNHPEVREIYQAELPAMANYLARNPPPAGTRVFIGYGYVLDYTTPRAYDFVADVPVSWFDDDEGFAWNEAAPAWYLVPESARLPPLAGQLLAEGATSETIAYANGDPAFRRYVTRSGALRVAPQRPLSLNFTDQPRLLGLDSPDTLLNGESIPITLHWEIPPGLPARPNTFIFLNLFLEVDASAARPGGTVRLTLFWQAESQPSTNYTVFNHIPFADRYTLPLPPEPGRYELQAGFYWLPTLERLPLRDGSDSLVLGTINVAE